MYGDACVSAGTIRPWVKHSKDRTLTSPIGLAMAARELLLRVTKKNWIDWLAWLNHVSHENCDRYWNRSTGGPGNGENLGICFVPTGYLTCQKGPRMATKKNLLSLRKVTLPKATTLFTGSWRVTKTGFITLIRKEMTGHGVAWNSITQGKKNKIMPSAHKTMGTVLRDAEGCILVRFLLQKETTNAAS